MDFNNGIMIGFWEAEIVFNITTVLLFFSNTYWEILRKQFWSNFISRNEQDIKEIDYWYLCKESTYTGAKNDKYCL